MLPRCAVAMPVPPLSCPKRIVFFGGDEVSVATLKKVQLRAERTGGDVTVIHPPAPLLLGKRKGKGLTACVGTAPVVENPVAAFCKEHGIRAFEVSDPKSMAKSSVCCEFFVARGAFEATVVCSCRYFIPNKMLQWLPPAINMHPSLLPKYRGASPLFETLRRGDSEGGVSVIKLEPGLLMDCGDVLEQRALPIEPWTDMRDYFPAATEAGADAVVDVLDNFADRWHAAKPQPRNTLHFKDDEFHAPLLPKAPGRLDWEAMDGVEAYNTWRSVVGHCPVGSLLCKSNAPVGDKIKNASKRAPMPICFKEAQHPSRVCDAVHKELEIVYDSAKPGAAYFPYTRNEPCKQLVGAVRCRTGWFFFTSATPRNSQPLAPATLAATLECRPGFVYNGVFQAPGNGVSC
jgi:methionyl-tRNA formyltransferase